MNLANWSLREVIKQTVHDDEVLHQRYIWSFTDPGLLLRAVTVCQRLCDHLVNDCADWQHVPDRCVPWRSIHQIRHRCDQVLPGGPGKPHWPDGGSVPSSDQVYVPQVWSLRLHPTSRRSVCAGPQHPQREDLHLPLVSICSHNFTSKVGICKWLRVKAL